MRTLARFKLDSADYHLLFLAHFFICSVGLLGVVHSLAIWLVKNFIWPANLFVSYSDFVPLGRTPMKPIELSQYGLSLVALLIYYAVAVLFIRYCYQSIAGLLKTLSPTRRQILWYIPTLFILNITTLVLSGRFTFLMFCLWIAVFLFPLLLALRTSLSRLPQFSKLFHVTALTLSVSVLCVFFYPYLTGGMAVSNDFMDMPEQTVLSSGIVDNTTYINSHSIGGLFKNDPRKGRQERQNFNENEFIRLAKSDALLAFVADKPLKYFYDEGKDVLQIKGEISRDDAGLLSQVTTSSLEKNRIFSFFYRQSTKKPRTYSEEEIEFIRKNARELKDQVSAGHYFHHQNTMLGTINEYALGKPQSATVFLYGWLGTVTVAKLVLALGPVVDFENYQKVLYSFYPLYYFSLLLISTIIFRKSGYVALVSLASFGCLFYLGFEYIRMAPGFNPLRHFFDIFALLCLHRYFFAPRRNLIYLTAALTFAVLAVLFSREFGAILLLAILAMLGIRMLAEKRIVFSELAIIAITVSITLIALFQIKTGKNESIFYLLMGIASPNLQSRKLYILLLFFSFLYVYLLKNFKRRDGWCYLVLFWVLYLQGLLVYYVWFPATHHLLSLGSVIALLFVLLLKHWQMQRENGFYETEILLGINCVLFMFLFVPGLAKYSLDQRSYSQIFASHKTYQWDFPQAKFISTMDPSLFKESTELIKKYSAGNAIFLLSKYDNILPFLSGKYSAMPYPQVDLNLVTKKQTDSIVHFIDEMRPEYLFVDTDMNRSYLGDIVDKNDLIVDMLAPYNFVDESVVRAGVQQNFGKVFTQVKHLYRLVEQGHLISVYKIQGH